jgi:hypothetical protein
MAKKAPKDPGDTKDRAEGKALLTKIRERWKVMKEADQSNREKALEDIKFLHEPGAQWDATVKKERGDRPCYEFNKLRVTCKRVINHIRANRPAWKVRAVEDGDKDTADVNDGLLRNIWNISDGDTIVDYAAEYVVGGGMGAWRVATEYSSDTAFNQDIFVRAIKNPFCLYADPSATDSLKRDASDWILTERISNKAYDERYPKAKRVSFDDLEFDDEEEWQGDEETRVCEYWYKKPHARTLALLPDGKTVYAEEVPEGVKPVRTREVNCPKIYSVIASGDAILEGPTEWAGKLFPFVQPHGEWIVIDGKVIWYGLTRHSKDAQREYNASRTAIAETIASTPTAKYWMTPEQYKGLAKSIADAHKQNMPVAFYNADPKAPGPPARMGGADVPAALVQEAMLSSDDIKGTSGIFDSSLGNQTNETSGVAIRSRQQQGEIATYNVPDNIAKAMKLTGEILLDLVPKIYDTARSIRILGPDLAEKYVKINTPEMDPQTGEIKVTNDVTRGKYDLTVTTGPSFSTQRQEAAEMYTQMGQAIPQLWGIAGDYMIKATDLPYSQQIAERIKTMLPPQIQQMESEGKPLPPEVQQAMQQAAQAMEMVDQKAQLVHQAAQEVEQSKAESDKAKAEAQAAVQQIRTEQAKFEAKVATELAKIATQRAQLDVQAAQLGTQSAQLDAQGVQIQGESQKLETERGKVVLADEAAQAIENIKGLAAEFGQLAMSVADTLQPPPPPKTKKVIRTKGRQGADLVAQIDEVTEDGQVVGTRQARVTRKGGEIVGELT